MVSPPNYGTTGGWRRTFDQTYAKGGVIYIDSNLLGFCMLAATRYIVSATAAFTIDVEYPDGTYAPHPDGGISGAANEIKVITGRWNSLKITTAGDVTVTADFTLGAWHK